MEQNVEGMSVSPNDSKPSVSRSLFVFRCKECKTREVITGDQTDDINILNYLEANTTSSGCHVGCGTMNYGVYENDRYFVC